MREFKIEGKREIPRSSDAAIQSVIDRLDSESRGLGNLPIQDADVLKPIPLSRNFEINSGLDEILNEKIYAKDNPVHIQEIRSQLRIATNLESPVTLKVIAELKKAA